MRRAALVTLAVLILAPACAGGDAATVDEGPPPRVAEELVPPTLLGDRLEVRLYTGEEGKQAFAEAGDNALVADGKIWEIRRGTTLVGVLQISTVKRRVDLAEEDHRAAILSILAGSVKRVEIEGVRVSFAETEDQTRYLWFGTDFFEVLTLKSSQVDPEDAATDLIRFQVRRPQWRPLPEAGEVG